MHSKYVQLGALVIALMLLSSAAVLSHSPAYADGDDNKSKKKTKEEKEKAKEAKKKAKERVKEAREKLEEAKKKAKEIVEEAKEKVKEAQNVGRSSGDDDDDDDDEDNANIQAAPAQFKINATGIAVVKRDKTASDLVVNLNTTTTKVKHNQVEMDVSGNITVGGKKYDTKGEGSIVFQGTPWGSALLKLKGKASDGSGKALKFQMRGSLFPESASTWKMVAKNGKLGPFIHLNAVTGKVVGSGTVTPLPTPTPAGQNHFVISNIASQQTAGVPFSVTVTAVDATGSTIRTYAGPMKIVNATGGIDMTVSTGFVNGVWTGMVNATKAAKFRLTAHDVANPATKGTSNEFTVVPAALAKIDLTPASVTLNRGASAEFTAKGLDRFGNEISGFAPSWSLSSSDFGSIAVTGNRATFTASSTAAAGSVVLTASSGSLSDTVTINISLTATQELHHFVISNIGPQTAGTPFGVTVTAARADGTAITTYANPIRLTDSAATLNTTASSGFVSGIWTGNVQVTKAGTDSITVQEVANPSKTGTSNDFAVAAGALDRFAVGPIANQTAGVEFDIVVKAVDAFGNVKTDYAGNVALGTNNGASPAGNVTVFTPATYPFTPADLGQHTFKAKMYNAKADTTVTANDDSKSGTSNAFRVSAASATKVTVSPTAVTLSVGDGVLFSAKAFDAFGNQLGTAAFTWVLSPNTLGTVTPSASTSTATFVASTTGSGTLTVTAGTGSAMANITVT